ncbi:MAG: DUF7523 family protein [Thermoplasmata archaeon]
MAPEPSRPPSTADVTRAYIDEHPSIRDALQEDIVNFAFLARKIQTERGLRNEEAIEIALRRYQQEVRRQTPDTERVLQVLRDSRLEVHNRVALVRIKEDWQVLDRLYQIGRGLLPELKRRGVFQIYQGTRALTILCEDDLLSVLLEAIPPKNVLDVERGLASVVLRSDPSVAEIPGVMAHLADVLFQRGINCRDTVSVHTDSLFVFREEEVLEGMSALSTLLSGENAPVEPGRPSPGGSRRPAHQV